MLKGFTRNIKPLEILTEEQLQAIHRGTLDVLETTGVRVEHDRALDLLAGHGCKVDLKEKRVRIPGYLVEECLRKCPSSFSLKARDTKNNLRFGGNNLYFSNSVGMRTVDLDSWEPRTPTMKEQNEGVRILDALDTMHMTNSYTPYMDIEGIPSCMLMLESLASRIKNSTKGMYGDYSNDSEVFAIKMAKAVGIELLCQFLASPPLTYYREAIEAAYRFTEAGFPIMISGGATMGGSGPVTIAGSTITNNAQALGGIVLIQLIKPGTGIIVSDFTFMMDMQFGHPFFGGVTTALHNVMFGQIWRRYGLPVKAGSAAFSSSKKIDFQCAYDKVMIGLASALSGANLIDWHGGLYAELTFHPALAVLEDDTAGWIGRFIEGVKVTEETLAIDLIEQVGPIPGQYLNTAHTRKWWKSEQFIPKSTDREPYPEWIKKGKKDAIALAKERMNEILAKHEPKPLTPEQGKAIDEILEEARSFYRQKGLM